MLGAAGVALVLSVAPAGAGDVALCRHVSVKAPDGRELVGIEDVVVDRTFGRLILSTYDRRAVDDALDAGTAPPEGGIYAIPLAALGAAPASLDAEDLSEDLRGEIALFPHGIGVGEAADAARLAVVNRRFDEPGSAAADLLLIELRPEEVRLLAHEKGPAYCRTNDAALADDSTILATFDHASCGNRDAWIERILSVGRAGVLKIDAQKAGAEPDVIADGLLYANGIEVDGVRGLVHVSASREESVFTYALDEFLDGNAVPLSVTVVPGGPDNLTIAADGSVIAAVHPSMFSLFLYMNALRPLPHSSVIRIRPDGTQDTLVEPGQPNVPGAATVAVLAGPHLVVASAWDTGLGLCPAPADLVVP